ncbi:MAG: hypothetical protein JNM84_06205 [Planctomycetes bacterium]|nr:hypothetical protein [Planctomycetota bacterium]
MNRPLLAFVALALLLCGSVAWLVRPGENARERALLEAPHEPAPGTALLQLGAGEREATSGESGSEGAVRERASSPAPLRAAERAKLSAGVLVRVVDRTGAPLEGVPVGLRLASTPLVLDLDRTLAPRATPELDRRFLGPRVRAMAEPRGALPVLGQLPILGASFQPRAHTWTPPREERAFAAPLLVASAETDAHGEALFERARESEEEGWIVEPLLATARPMQRELPSAPAPAQLVVLELEGLQRIELAAADDEVFAPADWRACVLSPCAAGADEAPGWRVLDGELRVARGATRTLLAERSAALRIEAWTEESFCPRLLFELAPLDAEPWTQRVCLDAGAALARLDFAVVSADGEPLESVPFTLELWDGQREHVRQRVSGARGAFRVFVDARRSYPPSAHLRLAMDSKLAEDRAEAHLELARALTPGAVLDLGTVFLGSGPLLYAGVVVDDEGRPVPHAWIDCEERNETIAADALGRFERRGIARQETLFLEPRAPGHYVHEAVAVRAGATNAKLVLQRGATLRGRLRLPPDLATREVYLRFATPVEAHLMLERAALLEPDGSFELDGLPEGWGLVTLEWEESSIYGRGFDLVLGANDAGELDLRTALARLELELQRLDGSAAANLECVLEAHSDERLLGSTARTSDERGRVRWWLPFHAARWTASAEGASMKGTRGDAEPRVLRLAR